MSPRVCVLLSPLLFTSLAIAGDKEKVSLPDYVLKAETVMVIVAPYTGTSVTDPTGNRIAQENVEKAIMKWGRFKLVMTPAEADLMIEVRKGTGQVASPTISGPNPNARPVIIEPIPGETRVGVQKGGPHRNNSTGGGEKPSPRIEGGPADDMFAVYSGGSGGRMVGGPAVWRYIHKNALRAPDVPAVEEFRKLIEKAEKQQKSKP